MEIFAASRKPVDDFYFDEVAVLPEGMVCFRSSGYSGRPPRALLIRVALRHVMMIVSVAS